MRYQMTQRMDYNAVTPAGVKALGSVYGYISKRLAESAGRPRLPSGLAN
jgi:hypothetical protein